ncbi:MAG: BatD family protein [Campylobacterales bacterium]|nr:BatD family protein [Campylobacterales bacterium]
MINLGKFLYFWLFCAVLAEASGVSAKVDRSSVVLGERVELHLQIEGEEYEEPQLSKLCGSEILSTARRQNTQIINGTITRNQTLSYSFMPTKSCTIDPIAVKIDGKYASTDPIAITVTQMAITKDAPFILEMKSEKASVYVGEPFKIEVILKQRHNAEAVDSKFAPPEMKGFWIKEEQQGRRFEEGEYTLTKVIYVVAAQQSGTLSIERAQLQVASRSHARDAWGQWFPQLQWRSFFSNPLSIDVKPLPDGVKLSGSFSIEATLDRSEAKAGEAVNLTLSVTGSGNFEDIGSLKPSIDGVNVFAEEPVIQGYLEEERYRGSWTQKIALVGDGDFTVPSIALEYFDVTQHKKVRIQTEPLHVTIIGAAPKAKEPIRIERGSEASEPLAPTSTLQTVQWWMIALAFGLGLLTGVLLKPWVRNKVRKEQRGSVHVDDLRGALGVLMRHLDDVEAAEMVDRLERKLYMGASEEIDKKALKALLKRLEF